MNPRGDVEVGIGEDSFSWTKEEGSLKQIVLRVIRKLSDISTQEMVAGYWDERPMKVGDEVAIIKTYHPDLRESFINGVDFLLNLIPHCPEEDTEGNFKERYKEIIGLEDGEYRKANEEEWSKDDWTLTKLKNRREIFKEIMLMLNRIDFFSGSEDGIEE